MKVNGSCHCGRIAYEAELDPARVGVCHCSDCQALSGSAFTVYAQVQREAFRLLRGEPKIYVKTAESGNRRAQLRPQVQLWCRSAMPWLTELGAVPKRMQGA